MTVAPSATVWALPASAVGASLSAVIVTSTVSALEAAPVASVTTNENVSV